jgi:hypothetical protein
MKLTDGHYINPYIIWKEFDHRGYVSAGFEVEPFEDIRCLKRLPGRKQIICNKNKMQIFISIPLVEVCPNTSVFNLSNKKLSEFYRSAMEKISKVFSDARSTLSAMINQSVELLEDVEHFALLSDFFHIPDLEVTLDPSESVYTNCLKNQKIEPAICGFKMADYYHKIFIIDKYSHNYDEIFKALKDYQLTIILAPEGSQIMVTCAALEEDEVLHMSHTIKDIILDLAGTSYYEPNDAKESFGFFESCIPGWMFGRVNQFAEARAGEVAWN